MEALWEQLRTNPDMSVQHFLSVIANIKGSKHILQSEEESESEQSEPDSEVKSNGISAETNLQTQGMMKCPVCKECPKKWKVFQGGHPACSRCAGALDF